MTINITEKKECCGCEACKNVCPVSCITIEQDNEGFHYPKVDNEKCLDCGKCVNACPFTGEYKNQNDTAFIAYNKDEEIRKKSSSGGIFFEFASDIVKNGGVVYGPVFDSGMKLRYKKISQISELESLMGSKYVQAEMGNSHTDVLNDLKQGNTVLFSGTPCYVRSIKNVIPDKLQDKLICIDFICHGVPSPAVFEKYINEKQQSQGKKALFVSFRDKTISWESFGMKIEYDGNITETVNKNSDSYLKGFLKNLYLRPSCHSCKVKDFSSGSDIKLADCWHIARGKNNDHKGTSTVFINTEKGRELWDRIKNNTVFNETDIKFEISENTCIRHSSPVHPNRTGFFSNYNDMSFDKSINTYATDSLSRKIKSKTKSLIKKLLKH